MKDIKNKNIIQVVNGAGAKPYLDGDDYVHPEYINDKKGCKLLHFNTELGYCMFDMKPKTLKIHYYCQVPIFLCAHHCLQGNQNGCKVGKN